VLHYLTAVGLAPTIRTGPRPRRRNGSSGCRRARP